MKGSISTQAESQREKAQNAMHQLGRFFRSLQAGDYIEVSNYDGRLSKESRKNAGCICLVHPKHKFIVYDTGKYRLTISQSDYLIGQYEITKLDKEEDLMGMGGYKEKLPAPPKDELQKKFEEYSGNINKLAKTYKVSWPTVRGWLKFHGIIDAPKVTNEHIQTENEISMATGAELRAEAEADSAEDWSETVLNVSTAAAISEELPNVTITKDEADACNVEPNPSPDGADDPVPHDEVEQGSKEINPAIDPDPSGQMKMSLEELEFQAITTMEFVGDILRKVSSIDSAISTLGETAVRLEQRLDQMQLRLDQMDKPCECGIKAPPTAAAAAAEVNREDINGLYGLQFKEAVDIASMAKILVESMALLTRRVG